MIILDVFSNFMVYFALYPNELLPVFMAITGWTMNKHSNIQVIFNEKKVIIYHSKQSHTQSVIYMYFDDGLIWLLSK